ncbi:IS66 family insertion sequence element accessory protein TnpB [Roseovarius sp. D22-M7]|uniref:IS66 family insertion sequence element accessory protein TnpB n=1 Tax=Roseovarius sp. D22-M7 TaxID=3127116 RepID=UPI003FA7183C
MHERTDANVAGGSVLDDHNPPRWVTFACRFTRLDRLKLLYWDGTGLVMTYKRLEDTTLTWPGITDGMTPLTLDLAILEVSSIH